MSIQVTEAAVEAVKQALADEALTSETTYLRIAVKAGGCSGFSYSLGFDDTQHEGDRLIEVDGVRILVDPKSEGFLSGTKLDYTNGLNGKGFVFENPNTTGSCGCGNSFSV
jgi:iron-sulfur cluster assembly protein